MRIWSSSAELYPAATSAAVIAPAEVPATFLREACLVKRGQGTSECDPLYAASLKDKISTLFVIGHGRSFSTRRGDPNIQERAKQCVTCGRGATDRSPAWRPRCCVA